MNSLNIEVTYYPSNLTFSIAQIVDDEKNALSVDYSIDGFDWYEDTYEDDEAYYYEGAVDTVTEAMQNAGFAIPADLAERVKEKMLPLSAIINSSGEKSPY